MDLLSNLTALNDWGLLALRIALAAIFIYHGSQKWAMWKMSPSEQMPAGMLNMMKFLSIVEPLGGVAVAVGFLTQPAALGLGIIMLGAINTKVRVMKVPFAPQDKTGWEMDLILLAACIALFFAGAGSIALDRLWFGI
ncbi:MAG: DoxX family protein [Candidatus Marinimicrobia bacterium]|nr:DoxX family protein [Candidatus Neomarinimicrobiota bacterium]